MIIRKFKAEDRVRLLRLIRNILVEIFKVRPKRIELDNGFFRDRGVLYVAEDKGQVIGCVGVIKQKSNVVRLKKMYIAKNYRGTGIAQRLYNKAQTFSKKKRYKKIILSTTPQMKRAISFYERNGFVKYRFNKAKNQMFFIKKI